MKSSFAALLAFIMIYTPLTHAENTWITDKDSSLEIVDGSILDFSKLWSIGPAGSNGVVLPDRVGHLVFKDDARPQRFLCTSLVLSEPNGGIPDKDETDHIIKQLYRTGYNLVRLHFIDAILMTDRKCDFDYDPVAFDWLNYLMARSPISKWPLNDRPTTGQ
jgi:hypothetical protein